jgi:glucose/mannose-6-phosphate isomerase
MLEEVKLWSNKLKDGMQLAHDFHYEHAAQLPKNIKKIVFLGMGASGISGRIIKTFLDKRTKIISFVVDSPELPNCIDNETLVIATSYSGNTWEVLDSVKKVVDNFTPTIILSHGGKLAALAEERNLPFALFPESLTPRSSLGTFLGFLLTLFDLMGIIGGKKIVEDFSKQVDLYLPKLEDESYFKDFLDAANGQDFFHIWGVSGESAAFAYRAQTQFNENSKVHAVTSCFPELCHNLINGFEKCKEKPLVLMFTTDFLVPSLEAAQETASEVLKELGVTLYKPPVLGDTWESQLFHIILWSDFASCYLGKSRGVNLSEVKVIERLKQLYGQKRVK